MKRHAVLGSFALMVLGGIIVFGPGCVGFRLGHTPPVPSRTWIDNADPVRARNSPSGKWVLLVPEDKRGRSY